MTLTFAGGSTATTNVNAGKNWKNGTTHSFRLNLPATAPPVSSITGISVNTAFGGGLSGDNWNVNKVALLVSFPSGSPTNVPPQTVVTPGWIPPATPSSGSPGVHDELLNVSAADIGVNVQSLKLIISTGNDDL